MAADTAGRASEGTPAPLVPAVHHSRKICANAQLHPDCASSRAACVGEPIRPRLCFEKELQARCPSGLHAHRGVHERIDAPIVERVRVCATLQQTGDEALVPLAARQHEQREAVPVDFGVEPGCVDVATVGQPLMHSRFISYLRGMRELIGQSLEQVLGLDPDLKLSSRNAHRAASASLVEAIDRAHPPIEIRTLDKILDAAGFAKEPHPESRQQVLGAARAGWALQ
mmetsp:Transcript_24849/g.79747  ORF Transcript_24849/g.79747 Transcript_24849/m.79747 type:complete len:227 (-) Transcript_24849:33-713(-)